MKVFKLVSTMFVSVALFTSCGDDTVATEQEEHLEPVAIALEDHEAGEFVAILFDEAELPDSTSRTSLTLVVGDTVEYHVVALCKHEDLLEECEFGSHDHESHAEEEHEEEGHEEEVHVEGESEYTLHAEISDSTVAHLHVHSDEFAVELEAEAAGTADLTIEIWHGSHADISDKVFQIVVE